MLQSCAIPVQTSSTTSQRATASSLPDIVQHMAPTRIGFIGLSTKGWAAAALVPPLFDPLLSSSYTLTALCTTSEASATETAKKFSELAGHSITAYHGEEGLRAIANDPNVDLVAVSVKIPDHYKAVMPAIEAGKDIYIEWSVGKNYTETVEIAEAAKRKGVRVLVGAQGIQNSSLQKVKELVHSGAIGRIFSTTAILAAPVETHYWGKTVTDNSSYCFDINNGTTPFTISIGHFLSVLTHILGDFTEVSASGAIQASTATFVDAQGIPTSPPRTLSKTAHDQVALTGVLASTDGTPGVFVNVHCRAALPLEGPNAGGRTLLKWIIDGEKGTIEVRNDPTSGVWGAFTAIADKLVFLNGEPVAVEKGDADRLDNPGKAWLEFAKGEQGRYWGIEESVKLHRVLDAAQTSIATGQRIVL